jgi:hypothetical protein
MRGGRQRFGTSSLAFVATVGALTIAFGGCGSSASTNSSSGTTTGHPSVPGLGRYLVRAGDERGLTPGSPSSASSASGWVNINGAGSNANADEKRLRAERFLAGDTELLSGGGGAAGLSYVIRFASPSGAQQEAMHLTRTFGGPAGTTVSHFAVSGVPGAVDFVAAGGGQKTGVNIVWVDGRCAVLIGNLSPGPAPIATYDRPLVAAARTVYGRSRGNCR